jgi:dihydrolipoamide dehydrogenase
MLPRALSTEDEGIIDIIVREFKKSGIRLLTNVKVEKAEKDGDGMMAARLSNGEEAKTEMVLVSVGRKMNSENLGL